MRLVVDLSERTFEKLRRLKEDAKLGDKPWEDYFKHLTRGVSLVEGQSERIHRATQETLFKLWTENLIMNVPEIIDYGKYPEVKEVNSIGTLAKHSGKPALVIGAGPSIYKYGHIQLLSEHPSDRLCLFLCDRMLIPCLRGGVTPDRFPNFYVASVDGNRDKIVKWFDDPVVDKWAGQVTGLFASTVAPNALQRFKKAGGRVKFFHGMVDSFWQVDSVTSMMNFMTGSTCLACGGNVGGTCFTLAYYLECEPVILCGLTYGYEPETPIEETAYYHTFKEAGQPMLIESMSKGFMKEGFNPDFGTPYKIDLVFQSYKDAFLEMAEQATRAKPSLRIINATEGGSLHGAYITGMRLKDCLEKYA